MTHYHPAKGERTELSVASFANWVDKTANLLDAQGVDADSVVSLPVLIERPAHWMGLVWPFALWQLGLTAHVTPRAQAAESDLAVIGPDDPRPLAWQTMACSLHPWGLPLADLPDGVVDFSSEALAQPDVHQESPAGPGATAWSDAERQVLVSELTSLEPIAGRVALAPVDAWEATSVIARALLGGGSVVLVEGTSDELAAIAATERAEPR